MSSDTENSSTPEKKVPNDHLREIPEPDSNDKSVLSGSALAGFVLLKLNGYHKPPLAEELSEPSGESTGGCTCNSVCTCVPVQTCACDSVCTCDTVTTGCVSDSSCYGGGGGGYGGYYAPCF